MTHRVDLYARRVLGDPVAGDGIVAGPFVRLACERHLRDRARAAAGEGPWQFSEACADLAIAFFETVLRLPDALDDHGESRPFLLEPPLTFIVGSLMGWVGPDEYRRFREAFIEMGKGNAKTPLLAGLGLFGLQMDGEQAAEIYSAAVTRDQARVLFRDAERMVRCSPELSPRIVQTVNNLASQETFSFFRPYSRDQGVKSGPRPHMALIDEVHEHPTPEVINKLKAGFKFRKQPIAAMVTNSGFDRTSICWQLHQHADVVLRQVLQDDRFFAYVCAVDDGDDPLNDESCWIKANPMLGVTITQEYLRRQVANAKNIPSELNTVLRLNFCVWTQGYSRAIDIPRWQACQAPPLDTELVGVACYGGLDLGQSDDFSAWLRIWPLEDGRIVAKARFWIPQAAMERYPSRPYDQWRRAGLLEVTEGNTTDYGQIEKAVAEDCARDGIREVAYDNRFAEQMAQNLTGQGIAMVNTPQGFQLNEALRKLFDLVVDGELCHGQHAVLSWMAANFVIRHGTKGDIRPDKDRAADKIDGIVALVMALDRFVRQPVAVASVYLTRGVLDLGSFL